METFYKTLTLVRLNAQLRQLVQCIDEQRGNYLLASHHANDYSTDGLNWREFQRVSFMQMQAAGDRIVELVTEFYNNQRG